jgi:hypothetical protein
MQLFQVKSDLAPAKLKEKAAFAVPLFDAEKYLADREEYNGIIKAMDEKKETKWNELQLSGFRLSIFRYHVSVLQKDVPMSGEQGSFQEIIKSFHLRFSDLSQSRDTLETMGRIFSPQLDLELEF